MASNQKVKDIIEGRRWYVEDWPTLEFKINRLILKLTWKYPTGGKIDRGSEHEFSFFWGQEHPVYTVQNFLFI